MAKACTKRLIRWLNTRHQLRDALEIFAKEWPTEPIVYELRLMKPESAVRRAETRKAKAGKAER